MNHAKKKNGVCVWQVIKERHSQKNFYHEIICHWQNAKIDRRKKIFGSVKKWATLTMHQSDSYVKWTINFEENELCTSAWVFLTFLAVFPSADASAPRLLVAYQQWIKLQAKNVFACLSVGVYFKREEFAPMKSTFRGKNLLLIPEGVWFTWKQTSHKN